MNIDMLAGLEDMVILDRTNRLEKEDPLLPFALDEWLCARTGEGGPAICHLWRQPQSFVMGLRDSRLPGTPDAARWLEAKGYQVAVRNSGGAAVPLDPGVVNISLILPKPSIDSFHFHSDFEKMYALIATAVASTGWSVDKGEIQGAYCPGDFDLSINGLKFCGIAQRRQTRAFVIQAFVIVEGSGQARTKLVRQFYDRAAVGADSSQYPHVTEDSTASLAEIVDLGLGAAEAFAEEVKGIIRDRQTEAGMAAAAASLRMPSEEELQETVDMLRSRYGIKS
ncbi:lipoate--protein ligase family protein [Cohnella sp. AR92]|uniref:lipoate--protein ligase family protein n=1 Tax=Cohnella sp. AR92 TaxID=648716 RepID=UPI001EE13F95|nr:lipoate--protein ligase family protein [Cohnella sp. AR92]